METRKLMDLWVAVFLLILAGCASGGSARAPTHDVPTPRKSQELLHGVLWTQTAVEYRALTVQSYLRAKDMLDDALADLGWTAALEQTGDFTDSPRAVILDVDETVLDNSAYEARLVLEGGQYELENWNAWCREEEATAIPGALAFTRYAAERGVTVFYVTNRSHTVEESTRRNLEKLGFPLDAGRDTLLTRGEREDWKDSDKAARRAEIASQFRILLLVGDNLGDFLTGEMASLAERAALAAKHQQNWGTRWIMLPNPQYGSWEGAIFGFDYGLTYEERLRMKYKALKTR